MAEGRQLKGKTTNKQTNRAAQQAAGDETLLDDTLLT